jgi:hypothetical protein
MVDKNAANTVNTNVKNSTVHAKPAVLTNTNKNTSDLEIEEVDESLPPKSLDKPEEIKVCAFSIYFGNVLVNAPACNI